MSENNILILNVGSSSLKFLLFSKTEKLISGKCDRIGGKESYIEFGSEKIIVDFPDFDSALDKVISVIKEKGFTFNAIAHRIVHGGNIKNTCLIDDKVEDAIDKYSKFAPLHNPPQLQVIRVCKKYNYNQYAVFDTSFYADIPKIAYDYALPREIVKDHDIRKYGFHGISHKSVTTGMLGKTISCHLGNGSSITASIDGKAVDTSMGLTPTAGLVMATRCGDIDPGLVVYLAGSGYDLYDILNKKSGFKAYSEYTDMLHILNHIEEENVKMAYDAFIYSIVKYVGAYAAVLNGVDNLIFTGGMGEHIAKIRNDVCKQLTYLGVEINDEPTFIGKLKNPVISTENSKVKVFVKDPKEEEQIVKEVFELLGN